MRSCFTVGLTGAIALLGAVLAAAQTPLVSTAQSATITDASVARIAYLEAKLASFESALGNCQTGEGCTSSCGATCCNNPGITAGFDGVLLAPHFSNGISYQHRSIVAPETTVTSYGYPTDYEFAPRFWLGYKGCNIGTRITYLQYDEELMAGDMVAEDATVTLFFDSLSATNGQALAFETSMLLHVLDMDVTKDFEMSCAKVTAGAGLRYAKLKFDYTGAVTSGSTLQFASSGTNSFEGIGPSAFIDFKAPLRRSCFSIIGGLRGAVLFGQGSDIESVARVIDPIAQSVTIEREDRSTGTLDASIGLQYDRSLAYGADAFVRCAWEGQMWMDVGSPVQSSGDMALEGFSFGFGVTR